VSTNRELLPALLESSLEAGVEVRFEADGRSMLPLIRPGDLMRVRRPTAEDPRVGDVVAIRGTPGGDLLVHRVVRLSGNKFVLRGDNTTIANGEFARGDALGIVTAVERNGRKVWFGSGRWGTLVALAVRTGAMNWCNRVALFVSRCFGKRGHRDESGSA
jgi:signal peptidase I